LFLTAITNRALTNIRNVADFILLGIFQSENALTAVNSTLFKSF